MDCAIDSFSIFIFQFIFSTANSFQWHSRRRGFLWLHIIPLIPSLIVTVFVLFHLLKNRALRTALNNHVIILMLLFGLVLELTDTVWFIHFYRTGTAVSSTHEFCLAWAFIDSSLFVSISLQMSWASIERHILIFHPHWFATTTKRFLFHYLPLVIVSVWPLIFYFLMLLILPCDVPFDYNRRLCGHYACVNLIPWVAMFDSHCTLYGPSIYYCHFLVQLFFYVWCIRNITFVKELIGEIIRRCHFNCYQYLLCTWCWQLHQ